MVQGTDVEQSSQALTYELATTGDFMDFRVNAVTGVITATHTFSYSLDRHNYQVQVSSCRISWY